MNTRKIYLWLVVSVVILATLACSLSNFNYRLPLQDVKEQGEEQAPQIVMDKTESNNAPGEVTYIVPDEVLLQDTLVDLYENVSPGVVSIQIFSQFGSGQGSGFVIDKEGYIVTNYHVVDGAEEVEVHFQSGLKVYGQVIGEDLDSDIAMVKVDVDPDELVPLALGDSSQVRVGQTVVAIGNPYGLNGTMTTGIVSARGRTLESIRQTGTGAYFSAGDLIQTDATINPGNSGGPLLNLNGEVIGINRAIQTSGMTITGGAVNTGIGFAVSSNILKQVLPSLKNGETYNYPYLGLTALSTLSLSQAENLGLSQATGAYVVEIITDGPSDKAGIRAGDQQTQVPGLFAGGDLIIGVDGQEVLEFSELLSYMMLNKKPGDEIVFTLLRNGEEMTVTVTLGERPDNRQ